MRNLHQIILQEYGLEARHLFRDWERLWLRASDYKNHRIFTLRCLHKDLVPVSIKLKSTLKTDRAKKIIRKAEKDLIQARIKAINSILDNVGKQTELCRSSLASIISTQRLRECQGFIGKVSKIRFNKVKQRQLNKFQNVVNKKEGNITRVSNYPQVGNNLVASRQACTHLPSGEGSNTPLASPLLSPREGGGPRASQSGLGTHLPSAEGSSSSPQATAHLPPREESSTSQAIAHLPPGEGSNSSPATAHLPPREGSSASQATAHLPREGSSSPQATAHLPPREGSNSSLATAHIPPREGSNSSLATAHLPPGEGSSASQATAHLPREGSSSPQATAHLPPREGSNSSLATAHLPPREGSNSSLATAHLPPREGSSASLATAHLPPGEGSSASQATAHLPPREGNSNSSQAGQAGNQARSGRQGFRHSSRHRAPHASQKNSTASQADSTNSWEDTPTPTTPIGFPKGLLMKNLTLGGSLTYPANF